MEAFLSILCQYKVLKEGNNCTWILMGHLVQIWGEKKTTIYFGSFLMSFDSIIDITKKALSLEILIASIVLNNSFGVGKLCFRDF